MKEEEKKEEISSSERISILKVGQVLVEKDTKEISDSEDTIEGVVKEIQSYPEEEVSSETKRELVEAVKNADGMIQETTGGESVKKKKQKEEQSMKDKLRMSGRSGKEQEKIEENQSVPEKEDIEQEKG